MKLMWDYHEHFCREQEIKLNIALNLLEESKLANTKACEEKKGKERYRIATNRHAVA